MKQSNIISRYIGATSASSRFIRMACALATLFVAAFVLSSCGGSAVTAPSPFQGTFAGNWTSTGDVGTATLTVTPGGGVTGNEVDTTINKPGTLTGSLNNNGTFSGTVTPQGANPVNASGTFQISGDSNTLSGSITYNSVNYTYTLTRQ